MVLKLWAKKQTSKQRGTALESRVERLLQRMGKWNIKKNIIMRDLNGNISEIDLSYGIFFKRYIECKNFTGPVPLEYVAKFKEVLNLHGIPTRQGLFITTSYYTPRATTVGIPTIDGEQLKRMEKFAYLHGALKLSTLLGVGAVTLVGVYAHYSYPGGIGALRRNKWNEWRKEYPGVTHQCEKFWQGCVNIWKDIKWSSPRLFCSVLLNGTAVQPSISAFRVMKAGHKNASIHSFLPFGVLLWEGSFIVLLVTFVVQAHPRIITKELLIAHIP